MSISVAHPDPPLIHWLQRLTIDHNPYWTPQLLRLIPRVQHTHRAVTHHSAPIPLVVLKQCAPSNNFPRAANPSLRATHTCTPPTSHTANSSFPFPSHFFISIFFSFKEQGEDTRLFGFSLFRTGACHSKFDLFWFNASILCLFWLNLREHGGEWRAVDENLVDLGL